MTDLSHTDSEGCLCARCVWWRAYYARLDCNPGSVDILESAFAAREAKLWDELCELASLKDVIRTVERESLNRHDAIASFKHVVQELGWRLNAAECALRSHGYRRSCDIPACNCGDQWVHGGHAHERLREIDEAMEYENGKTILQRVQSTVAQLSTALTETKSAKERMWETGHALESALAENRALRNMLNDARNELTLRCERAIPSVERVIKGAGDLLASHPPTDEAAKR